MSTGGMFILATNTGKQDKILTATEFLNRRLAEIRAKKNPNQTKTEPTLLDIERTHLLFTNAHFKPFVAFAFEYIKVTSASGSQSLGSDVQFGIPIYGDLISDMVLNVKINAPTLSTSISAPADLPYAVWCDMPGARLLKKTKFDVNSAPLDEYLPEATIMRSKFLTQPNKDVGWSRCMGQQIPVKGWIKPDETATPVGHRVWVEMTNGPQTPKQTLSDLEMMIPLQFWFNTDVRLALPTVAMPNGSRNITLTLATGAEMCGLIARGAGALTASSLSTPVISRMTLYINNIFTLPDVHKIYVKRISFNLIRVHRQQNISTTSASGDYLLNQMQWPIEAMFVGLRPTSQATSMAYWSKFSSMTDTEYNLPNLVTKSSTGIVDLTKDDAGAVVATGRILTAAVLSDPVTFSGTPADPTFPVAFTYDQAKCVVPVAARTIDTLGVKAHGTTLYTSDLQALFYNAYLPYTYGDNNFRCPDDESLMFITFCLYPNNYQPSGHINVSRSRELYIQYTSSVCGTGTPCELVVVASALNFALLSDGGLVLRYST